MPNTPESKVSEVEFRRAPKFLPFAITGGVLGLLFAVLIYALIPVTNRSSENIFGLLLLSLGSLGLGLGVLVAIIVDLLTARRVSTLKAKRVVE